MLIYRRREEGVERVTFSSCVRGRPEVGALRTYCTVLYCIHEAVGRVETQEAKYVERWPNRTSG
jgi:hypothetical protein